MKKGMLSGYQENPISQKGIHKENSVVGKRKEGTKLFPTKRGEKKTSFTG